MKLSSPALSLSTENAKVIRSAREEHVWVSRRLPNILGYGEVVSDFSFGEPFDDQNFEAKNFRYTIAEELFPITDLTNPCELAKAFKDIILCHQWLAVNAKIVHGDISVNNLMCRIVDGKGYGVLNDFDLAYFIGAENKKPSSKQRTGTKPFIAMDLLHPVVQIDCDLLHVRCDLESFMYVFAWVVCRFQDKEEIANPPLKDWTEGPLEHVRMTKLDWLSFWTDLTPQYNPLIMILYYLRRHVRNGVHVKARALDYTRLKMKRKGLDKLTSPSGQPFDYLTLDGNITYDKFISAFEHIH